MCEVIVTIDVGCRHRYGTCCKYLRRHGNTAGFRTFSTKGSGTSEAKFILVPKCAGKVSGRKKVSPQSCAEDSHNPLVKLGGFIQRP